MWSMLTPKVGNLVSPCLNDRLRFYMMGWGCGVKLVFSFTLYIDVIVSACFILLFDLPLI